MEAKKMFENAEQLHSQKPPTIAPMFFHIILNRLAKNYIFFSVNNPIMATAHDIQNQTFRFDCANPPFHEYKVEEATDFYVV